MAVNVDIEKRMEKAKNAFGIYPEKTAKSLEDYFRNALVYNLHAFDNTLSLITSQKALQTLTKYPDDQACKIALYFVRIALHQPLIFDKSLEVIGKYESPTIFTMLYWFVDKTLNQKPEVLKNALEFLGKFDERSAERITIYFNRISTYQPMLFRSLLALAEKYPSGCDEIIVDYLSRVLLLSDTKTVQKMLKVLGSNKVIKTVSQYQGETAKDITNHLGFIAINYDINYLKMIMSYCDFVNSSSEVNSTDLERIISEDQMRGCSPRMILQKNHLKRLSKEEGTLRKKVEAIEVYDALTSLKLKISSPSLKDAWKKNIKGKIEKAIKKIYGVKGKNDMKYVPLLSIDINTLDKEVKKDIKRLLKHIPEKRFNTGKIYEELIITKLKEKTDPKEATKALIYGLLSRPFFSDKEGNVHARLKPLKHALKFFDKEKLRGARKHIRNLGPGKVYNLLKDDLRNLEKGEGNPLEQILGKIWKNVAKNEDGALVESISDMISQITWSVDQEIKKISGYNVNSIVFKMQKIDITDIFDNRSTHCCAFFPDGANCEAAIGYLKDPEIGLLHAKAVTKECAEDEGIETSGVAILVNCEEDYNKNKVLLVDSVESGETISRIDKIEEFNKKYLESIIQVAEEQNAKKIVFNSNVNNSGPKSFNKFLESKGLKEDAITLKKNGNVKEDFYLEAFGGWTKPQGRVKGYVLEL